jgi:diacylglycerol kinase family enzyme
MIPIGTGNDFVKMIPGTGTRAQALATLAHGTVTAYDVGRARWDGGSEYFINAMGTGIDVEVVRAMPRIRNVPGGALYVAGLLRALVRYRPLPVSVDVDGESIERRIMLLAVANGACIGGTFRICPRARPDDGLLDVCLVEELPLPRIVRTVLHVLRGTHEGLPGVTTRGGRVVRITSSRAEPLFFQLDGELRHASDALEGIEVTLEPARMNVLHDGRPSVASESGIR